jgi:hypothetical protein
MDVSDLAGLVDRLDWRDDGFGFLRSGEVIC